MRTIYKIRIGSEVYSKKSGMRTQWNTRSEEYESFSDACESIEKEPGKVIFSSATEGTIYRYSEYTGTPMHKQFKIIKKNIK